MERLNLPRILPPFPGYETGSPGEMPLLSGWGERNLLIVSCVQQRHFFLSE